MSTATTTFTSKKLPYNLTTVNYITAIVMVIFHIGAVAALFHFTWTNFLVALVLHWMAVGFGISLGYHRLHTHRGYKTSKAVRVLPRGLRHADARGRDRSSGSRRTASITSTPTTKAIRTRRTTAASGRTWAGSCSATRTTTTPR